MDCPARPSAKKIHRIACKEDPKASPPQQALQDWPPDPGGAAGLAVCAYFMTFRPVASRELPTNASVTPRPMRELVGRPTSRVPSFPPAPSPHRLPPEMYEATPPLMFTRKSSSCEYFLIKMCPNCWSYGRWARAAHQKGRESSSWVPTEVRGSVGSTSESSFWRSMN